MYMLHTVDRLTTETARLKARIAALEQHRAELDCRYTSGPVADTGGAHCPPAVPCARCRAEKAEAEVKRLEAKVARVEALVRRGKERAMGGDEEGLPFDPVERIATIEAALAEKE